jgi:hypothetical protein
MPTELLPLPAAATGPLDTLPPDTELAAAALAALPENAAFEAVGEAITAGAAALDTALEVAAPCDKVDDAAVLGRTLARVPALAAPRRAAGGRRLSGVLDMGGAVRLRRSRPR